MDDNEYDNLILAALLHDIGKFWWRAGGSDKHQKLSEIFASKLELPPTIDRELLSILTLRHHDSVDTPVELSVSGIENPIYRRLASIVSEADNISSAIGIKCAESDAKHALQPLFAEIKIRDKGIDDGAFAYKPQILDLKNMSIPIKDSIDDITLLHEKLWDNFCKEMANIPHTEFLSFFNSLHYLLEKYTTAVSSSGNNTKSDISLFDHLKTTAAISSCMYKYLYECENTENISVKSKDAPMYMLIGGDISGIQKFIYNIKSPEAGHKGMAKRLRGRSFYISLLAETFAHTILNKLNLPITNLLWCGGGHFYILAPNTPLANTALNECRQMINAWILEHFREELYLALASVESSSNELRKFSNVIGLVNHRLSVEKNSRHKGSLKEFFAINRDNYSVCNICGAKQTGSSCQICDLHETIGAKLQKAKYFIRIDSNKKIRSAESTFINFDAFGVHWGLVEDFSDIASNDLLGTAGQTIVYKLNDTDFLQKVESDNVSYGFKFIGNAAPKDDYGNLLTFGEIAERATGADRLGILRMDVDNLGCVFAAGMGKENMSISRVSTLSRQIDMFFSGYINEIVREIPNIYITYSGGDDLFVVGAWDAVVQAGKRINERFNEYCCHNPALTISGGIFMCKPKFPIGRAAELAAVELEKAKEGNKNAVCVFGKVVSWDRCADAINLGELMFGWMNDGSLSSSMMYLLLNLHQQHFEDNNKFSILWLPKFLYSIKRNIRDIDVQSKLKYEIIDNQHMNNIIIPVTWASLKTRRV